MRLTLDLFGWTMEISANRNTSDDTPTEHDHLGGSYDIAPPPDGEYVYEERANGFGFATTGREPDARTPDHATTPSPAPHAETQTRHDPTRSANGYG